MTEISFADINGFASPDVPPQLQAVIAQEVTRQLGPLMEENARLRARLAALEEEENGPDEDEPGNPGGREGFRIEKEVAALRARLADLRRDHEDVAEFNAVERAADRRRLADLEEGRTAPPSPTEKTKGHFQHVKALLLHADHGKGTVKFLASRLEVCKRQAWNIIHRMEREGLINVIWDPHHKQRRLVELRQQIGTYA